MRVFLIHQFLTSSLFSPARFPDSDPSGVIVKHTQDCDPYTPKFCRQSTCRDLPRQLAS
ncbi:hypothetical protein AMATHDRAFT_65321 [Amanita thiersii Skay4041]|uniref:Uncharacterized protein n=1 Tax=Amanita thiersii Skay4041 TaxID=703135 RepID=A0A2A9NL65_9AGAR|nr:hypothetical protein AMATHDRAFT_65321 [Amanita thiersii Skay4041]